MFYMFHAERVILRGYALGHSPPKFDLTSGYKSAANSGFMFYDYLTFVKYDAVVRECTVQMRCIQSISCDVNS